MTGRKRQDEFVNEVLARTTGSPCARARTQLPDLVDRALEGMDRQLVQAHLEHCSPCRSLAVTLGWLGQSLQDLAELDPGPAFTRRVLDQTSGINVTGLVHASSGVSQAPGLLGMLERLAQWWERQVFKPRFAMQAAYAATVVLVLLTSIPGSPLKGTPNRALQAVQAGPTYVPVIGTAVNTGSAWVGDQVAASVATLRGHADAGWNEVAESVSTRGRRTSSARTQFKEQLAAAWSGARQGRLGQAGYQLIQAAGSSKQIWHLWWIDNNSDMDHRPERSEP